jgi:hypothetical protein
MTTRPQIALYGATGFTGKLVARELAAKGEAFIIAGRNREKLDRLAGELRRAGGVEVEARAATVDDPASLDAMLEGVDVLINCAGPFTDVGLPVAAAALRNVVHYFDTTGEQAFMKRVQRDFADEARKKGVVLAPACAYEYATGAFAARLAVGLGARRLGICYAQRNVGTSRGTKKSILRALADDGYTFVDGHLEQKQTAYRTFDVPRPGGRPLKAAWFPGGEPLLVPLFAEKVSQVESCIATGERVGKWLKRSAPVLRRIVGATRPLLDRLVERSSGDPGVGEQRPEFVVTAFDPEDSHFFTAIAGGDPYATTARIIVEAARRTLAAPPDEGGFTSPAALFDARDFLGAVGLDIVD